MLKQSPSFFSFQISSIFVWIFFSLLFSMHGITSYIPLLAYSLQHYSLNKTLWTTLGWGVWLDISSSSGFIGLHAWSAFFTIILLYKYKSYIFYDRQQSLLLFAFLLSCLFTFFYVLLTFLFTKNSLSFLHMRATLVFYLLYALRDALITLFLFTFLPLASKVLSKTFLLLYRYRIPKNV